MVFTSFNFLLFFPVVLIVFYLLPNRFRWLFILLSSLFFYFNIKPVYVVLLLTISLITYFFAINVEVEKDERKKEKKLILSITLVLLPLLFFKYFSLIDNYLVSLLHELGINVEFTNISYILPVGISFYTFMALGYLIDVYNEEVKAEKNIGKVILFLSFFPLVLSGPIERATSMFSQFREKFKFDYKLVVNGFKLMLWGYFMKLVIADRLAIYVNEVFGNVVTHSGKTLFLATTLYPFQIYADLGGYSLLAIGCANIMGIKIRPNFNRPFFSNSMSEFWRRWHMSLITWLTDYLYTPLAFFFRKYNVYGIVIALMLTFIISGIWHGAALTFVFWGALQGVVLSIEALTKKRRETFIRSYKLQKNFFYLILSIIFTYYLFAFSLIFGGAVETISESFLVIRKIIINDGSLYLNVTVLSYAFVGLSILFLSELRDEYFPNKFTFFNNKNLFIRWGSYYFIALLILLLGVFERNQFIYFQF